MPTARMVRPSVLMIEQGGRGGVADYTDALATGLVEGGWHVTVLTATDHLHPARDGVAHVGAFRYVRDTDGRLGRLLRRTRLSRVVNGLRHVAVVPRVARLARRHDAVHVQGGEFPPITVVLLAALRLARRPAVHTPHNTFDRGGHEHDRSRRAEARLARRVVVHARADVAALPDEARAKAVVVPHGDYRELARSGGPSPGREAARAALGLPADATVALLFGQIRADKGLDDLLAAALAVPAVTVLVGGEDQGGVLAGLDGLLSDPRLEGRVVVREGFLDMTQAAGCFAACDVVVLPYRRASQSGVLQLAYGFARPVVVYPVGGLPEAVVEGETGWVTGAPDETALAVTLDAVVRAGAAECARRGAAGERLAAERYSWRTIAATTAGLYAD